MVKLGIFYEEDEKGKLTGRVQVADVDMDEVFGTFDTEEEAEKAMAKMQAEFDRNDKIDRGELREFLVNDVMF